MFALKDWSYFKSFATIIEPIVLKHREEMDNAEFEYYADYLD
jgi:hypothetical protein